MSIDLEILGQYEDYDSMDIHAKFTWLQENTNTPEYNSRVSSFLSLIKNYSGSQYDAMRKYLSDVATGRQSMSEISHKTLQSTSTILDTFTPIIEITYY